MKKKQKFVKDIVMEYQKKMRLQQYDIRVIMMEENVEEEYAMTINSDIVYLRVYLYIYPVALESTEAEIRSYVKHELTHVIIEPLVSKLADNTTPNESKQFTKDMENAVEHISRLIC